MIKAWVLAVGLLLIAPRVSVSVNRRVLMAGGDLRVTCTVPKQADNRWLVIGVPDVALSTRQLDGDAAPITHTLEIRRVPCGASDAVCRVVDALGSPWTAVTTFQVSGCDDHSW